MSAPRLSVVAFVVVSLIQACSSGDGGTTSSIQSGVFLDSAVHGVSYSTTSGLSGMTDANGQFNFRAGDQVIFRMAGVALPAAPAKAILTPVDLAGASAPDDPAAIAIARLLQSLDKDGNPDNGLQIDLTRLAPNASAPAKWAEVSEADLGGKLAQGISLRSETEARKHFRKTFDSALNEPRLTLVARYAPFAAPYLSGTAAERLIAEIVAFHPESQSAFITVDTTSQKSSFRRVSLASLQTAALQNPTTTSNLSAGETTNVAADLAANGGFIAGGVQSLDVSGNLLAIAVQAVKKTDNGRIAFYTLSKSGAASFLSSVEVGSLPDSVTFSPDGKFLVVANEGELPDGFDPANPVDPEGTISIIPILNGTPLAAQAVTLDFKEFNVGAARHSELPRDIRIGRPGATVAQDLEPEYVAISDDSKTAFVTLQENNAIAVVDLEGKRISKIFSMGFKDHGLDRNRIAPSDRFDGTTKPSIAPTLKSYAGLFGIPMPDGIASFTVNNKVYLITANEGDDRDDFLPPALDETLRIGATGATALNLDPTAFPNATALKNLAELGRLNIIAKSAKLSDGTAVNFGDTDGDGDYDRVYALGARSFTILDASTGAQVFDSGSDIERIVYNDANDDLTNRAALFTVLNDRLDNKGPEPEGVVVGTVRGQTYAFIGLERSSGILVYNVSDPTKPRFVQYVRNTTTLADGDISPEGMKFVPADKSPNGKPLLLVGYEVSGSMAVFTFE